MDRRETLQRYKDIVEFLGECFADTVEVVLHDLSDFEHSVIAIKNGHVTGRDLGAPLSMYARNRLREAEESQVDRLMNYPGLANSGRQLRSSSYFIRGGDGEIIGMLCVNVDVSDYQVAQDALRRLTLFADPDIDSSSRSVLESPESFPTSINDLIEETLDEVLGAEGIDVERLSASERIGIVARLQQRDLFQVKGAVRAVADYLRVSEATVYRYLSLGNQRARSGAELPTSGPRRVS